jgi:hypothetical protein
LRLAAEVTLAVFEIHDKVGAGSGASTSSSSTSS